MQERSSHAIELRDLRFRWTAGSPDMLDIPELVVPSGQRVFIQGPSGSGKSTLLSLIGGVVRPEPGRGTIHLLGHPLHRLSGAQRDAVRGDHVGFIFQMFNLLASETLLLALAGIGIGLGLLYASLYVARPIVQAQFGVQLAITPPTAHEAGLLGLFLLAAFLVSLIPAYRTYRTTLTDGLDPRV